MSRYLSPSLLLLPLGLALGCRAPFEAVGVTPPPPPPPTSILPMRIGSAGPDFARAVATDLAGNAYVASYFSGTVDFDAGAGVTAKTAIGPYDIALAKYAADGTFQWVFTTGGSDVDVPFDVKVAPDGGIYLTGYTTAGALCSGEQLQNAGGRDILLMRISPAGTCDWALSIGSTADDEGHALAIDANGDVLVTGTFAGTVDFDPGPGTGILISRGGTDGFVARYSSNGTFLSVAQFGGLGDDAGNAIALRPDGDVMVAGTFSGTATFGSTLAPQLLLSAGGLDFFLARMSPTLGLEWAVRGGGAGDEIVGPGCISVTATGITYVAGSFTGTTNVAPGQGPPLLISHGDADVFVANFDANGVWASFARSFGGPGTESVAALTQDVSGNIYLSGSFQGSVDFDQGASAKVVTALSTSPAADAYVLSLNQAGDLRWVDRIGAVISGDGFVAIASGLSLSPDGSLWAVGRFFGLADLDPGAGTANKQSLGDADQFIVRYDPVTGALKQ
ncbi:MAG: hypothetical protein ACREK8_00805 [Gemmatimonadales bacterium]